MNSAEPVGDETINNTETEGLRQRIKALLVFRFVLGAILLGQAIILKRGGGDEIFGPPQSVIFGILSCHFAAALAFFLLHRFRFVGNWKTFAYIQIVWDAVFTTAFVYISGGVESDFKFLYWLSIVLSTLLLFRGGAIVSAACSGVLYSGILVLEYLQIIPSFYILSSLESIYMEDTIIRSIVFQSVGFFLVAFLSSWVTDRAKRVERALVEKSADLEDLENLMGRIVESLTSGLVTLDAQDRVNYWSRSAEAITGIAAHQARGRDISVIFPQAREGLKDFTADSDPNRSWRWEMNYHNPEGQSLVLGFSVAPLKPRAGSEKGKVVIFQDLTEHRLLEDKVKRADRLSAIGELAARMAHEIRNPLTSMSGSIEVLKSRVSLPNQEQRLMDIVLRETDRLNQLLTDFLVFAKPTPPQIEDVSLDRLISDTVELFSSSEHQNRLDFQLDLASDVVVKGDSRQLSQVLWNLLKNASEAMAQTGKIEIVLRKNHNGNASATIEIVDHGPGIPNEARNRIFHPFFTTKQKGTGLGLATVKRIIDDHAGEISVENRSDGGVCARIVLPEIVTTEGH